MQAWIKLLTSVKAFGNCGCIDQVAFAYFTHYVLIDVGEKDFFFVFHFLPIYVQLCLFDTTFVRLLIEIANQWIYLSLFVSNGRQQISVKFKTIIRSLSIFIIVFDLKRFSEFSNYQFIFWHFIINTILIYKLNFFNCGCVCARKLLWLDMLQVFLFLLLLLCCYSDMWIYKSCSRFA